MLEVRLLGTFEVKYKKKSITVSSRPAQSLFAYLILHAGTSYRREKLAGVLWPDSLEVTARDNLRHALWRLRKAFPSNSNAEYLHADDVSIAFNDAADYWLDATELEKLSHDASTDELMACLSEYQGELLPGFYEEWVVLEREHLASRLEHHMARLMSILQEDKRWLDILDWAERWIRLGQKPEPAYRALMSAHAAKGDMSKSAATYERCVKSLKEFGVEPSEQTRALYHRLKTGKESLEGAPSLSTTKKQELSPKTNLPVPLTSFIGRERELEVVQRLMDTTRLLTLTGAGGIGKTRLAIQAASQLARSYPDGVWWVELAPLSDGTLVPQVVAQVLGMRESSARPLTESLRDFLQEKQLLLVLDNCEHLIAPCAQFAYDLLSHCAPLRILATSREALGITGETVFSVPVLSFPALLHMSHLQNVKEFESIQLFVERASAIQPDLALTQENVFVVTQICYRLDGLPLAIELAAARVKMFTLQEIARRLDDRFRLLAQGSRTALPRHQTLRAAIDWSYELLSGPEQTLLRRLSIFAGGFTLEAAEAVAAGGGLVPSQVMDLLGQLIIKSLVIQHGQSGPVEDEARYGMLDSIRAYAGEKLEEAEEEASVRKQHLEYFASFARRAQQGIYSTEQAAWFRRLDQEVDNLRVALEWEHSLASSLRQKQFVVISSLSLFWERSYRSEIVETLRKLLDRDAGNEPTAEKARALDVGGFLLWCLNRLPEARSYLEESIQIATKLEDDSLLVWPLMYLGWTFWGLGEHENAKRSLERSLSIAQSLGEQGKGAVAVAMAYLGDIPYAQGNLKEARRLYEKAILALRELENPSMLSPSLRRLGYVEIREGNFAQAVDLFCESLESNRLLSHQHGTVASLAGFAAIQLTKQNFEQAATLYGCIENLLRTSDQPFMFTDTVEYERCLAQLKQSVDEELLTTAWSTGSRMTLEQAMAYALKETQG